MVSAIAAPVEFGTDYLGMRVVVTISEIDPVRLRGFYVVPLWLRS